MTQPLKYTQNFLHSPQLVGRMVALAALPPGSTVLEIGPGKGIITKALAAQVGAAGRVLAVELDAGLVAALRAGLAALPQVQVLHQDIRDFSLEALAAEQGAYQVFANPPFNITSQVMEWLFHPAHGPGRAHLILQKDALIGSSPYGPTETFKSLMIKPLYTLELMHEFTRADFRPMPGVDTALFRFEKISTPALPPGDYAQYKDFLAFVSKDRVGEGTWNKAFSKRQLQLLISDGHLVAGRGLKSQAAAGLVSAFALLQQEGQAALCAGAMALLRQEQARREAINQAGGHHRRPQRGKKQ